MNRSRTIAGLLCLAAIGAPIMLAPMRLGQSLGFVREIENREPNAFPALESTENLLDKRWWGSISLAFEDRVPFRQELISLNRSLLPAGSDIVSDKIASGIDEWLFWRNALAKNFGTRERVERASGAMDKFLATLEPDTAFFILVAPDKPTIYPEKLTPDSYAIYETSLDGRTLLHDWFATPDAPHRIDLWTLMLERKAESDQPIYEPGGQHHNSIGAMVMGKAIVDAADTNTPALWDDGELVDLWTKTVMPELAKRGGDWARRETYTRSQIVRQGVEVIECTDCARCIEEKALDRPHRSPHFIAESSTRRLIEGRTLIIRDSFIEMYLEPTLTQFFADVRFIHADDIDHASLLEAMESYDRVYIESVERYFPRRAEHFFSAP
jgi:hypothetical protein